MGRDGAPLSGTAFGTATIKTREGKVGVTASPATTRPTLGFHGKGVGANPITSSTAASSGALLESSLPAKKDHALHARQQLERLDALEAWKQDITNKSALLLDQRKHYDELQLELAKAMCKIETLQTETNSLRQTLNATAQADRLGASASLSVIPVLQKKMQTTQEAVETLSKRLQPLEETVKKGLLASQEAFAQSLLLFAQTTQALQIQDTEGRCWFIGAHEPLILRPPSTVMNGTLYMQTILPHVIDGNLEHLLCTVPVNKNGVDMVMFQPSVRKAPANLSPSVVDACVDACVDAYVDTCVDMPVSSVQKRQKT
jgi:hypothetical protein